MTMTEYFPITPLGVGTAEIEAFGSLLCRMARAHSVSIYVLSMHLANWWMINHPGETPGKYMPVTSPNPTFCGIGSAVELFSTIVSQSTGCQLIERTTFLSLRSALDANGQGVTRRGRAWCPACLDESHKSGDDFYDRLMWALPIIIRCPEHKVELVSHCPICECKQTRYHHLGHMDLCYKCSQSMRSEPSTWKLNLAPALYERDALSIVRDISSGSMIVVEDAYNVFMQDFSEHLDTVHKRPAFRGYVGAHRQVKKRVGTRPRLITLLGGCAAFGVNPTDVLRDPSGAAKTVFQFEFARWEPLVTSRPRRSAKRAELARKRLEWELSNTGERPFPNLSAIAQELGVSIGFLNYRVGDLIRRYVMHRSSCWKRTYKENREKALLYLRSGPIYEYPSAQFPSHDHLVAATVRETGVGVRAARGAVRLALTERYGTHIHMLYRRANCHSASLRMPTRGARKSR